MRLTHAMRRAKRTFFAAICVLAFGVSALALAPTVDAGDCDTYIPTCGDGLCDCGKCDSLPMATTKSCGCGKCKKPLRLNLKNTVVFKTLDTVAGGIEHVLGLDSCGTAGCRCKDGGCDAGCDSGCQMMPMQISPPMAAPIQMVPSVPKTVRPMTPTPAPILVQPRSTPRTAPRSLPTVPPLDSETPPEPEMTAPRIIEPEPESQSDIDAAPPLTPIPRETPLPEPQTQPRNATDSIGELQPAPVAETPPVQPEPDATPGLNMPAPDAVEVPPSQIQPFETRPREMRPREPQPREAQPRETQPRTRPRMSDPNDIFNDLPETPNPRPREPRPREPQPNTAPGDGSIFDMLDDPFGDSARLRRPTTVRPASHGVRSSQRRTYQPVYPRVGGSRLPAAQPIGTGLRPATTVDRLRPVNHLEPVQRPAPPVQKRVLAPYRQSRS
ncbi:MAG: hypothetical protein AAFU85_16975 [Planctomycetota bacterium]